MRNLCIIALGTLLQLRRERLMWSGALVALLLAVFALAFAPLSLHQDNRIVLDAGLAVTSLAGTLLAVSITVQLVGRELHEGRAHALLAGCLHRHTWLLGRSAGLICGMAGIVGCIGGTTALLSSSVGGPIPAAFWPALLLTCIETVVAVCVTLLYVSWTTPALAGTYALGTLVAGHMSAELLALAPPGRLHVLWRAVWWVLPDMQRLSLRAHVADALPVSHATWALQAGYGLSYAIAALGCAMLIVTRRRCL